MLEVGEIVDDRYRIAGLLGRGGMAEVFRATDTATERGVALKVLRQGDDEVRFGSEVEALGRLDHPNLVRLRGTGVHDGLPYLVLELAEGPSLADEIAAGRLGVDRTRVIGAQVADALAHAHRLGVVHRDVKPSNVLFDGSGRARLADFGIARVAGVPSLTRTGYVVGSAPYLAPEQVEGRPVTPAADVYALGLVLLECLTGRRCYRGSQAEVAVARLRCGPDVPCDLPAWLRDVLHAMTALDAARRPPADAVATALRDATSDSVVAVTALIPVAPRRLDGGPARRVAGGVAAALAVVASLGWIAGDPGGAGDSGGPPEPSGPVATVVPTTVTAVEAPAPASTAVPDPVPTAPAPAAPPAAGVGAGSGRGRSADGIGAAADQGGGDADEVPGNGNGNAGGNGRGSGPG